MIRTVIIIVEIPAERKVNRTADLDAALAFVIGRIEEEATRSDEPLSDGQRFLLHHLPKGSALPQADGADPESPMLLLPRDTEYERLCGLAKAAHRNDLRLNPALALDWSFAAAVSKLNGHAMSLALAVGGRDSAPTGVGSLASHCCRAAVDVLRRDCRAARGNRTLDSIPVGGCRCCLHRCLDSFVLCFAADRRMAVAAEH